MRSSPSRAIALLPLIFLVILGCIIPSIPVATAQVASSPVTQSSVICGQVKFATVGGVLDPVLLPFDNSGVALWQPQNFNPDAYYRILDPQIAALNPPLQSQEYGPIQRHIASWSSYVQISGPNDCAAAPPPPTPTPNVSIAPTSGSAGTTVTATGTKWAPGGQVIDILWDGNQLTETNADDAGNFSFSFPIPQDAAAGDHQLTIRDGNTGFEGTARFTVTAAPPPPTPVPSAVPPTPVASSPIPTIVNASPTGLILSSIAGLVTSPDGIGLPDVKMQVTDTEGNKVKSVHTVANGEFKVSDLPPGTYIVTPNLAGYTFSPAAADPVTVPPSVKNQHFVGTSLLVPTASSIVTPIVVIPTVFPTNSPISLPATVQPVVQTPALPISTSSPTRTSAPRPASPTRTPTSALPTTNSSPSNVLGIQAGSSASNVLGIGAGVPDLTITAVELNPKTPVQGEPVQLRLTIVNKGARRLGEKWEFTGQIVLKDDKSVVVLPERDFESNHSSSITYANLDVTESWHLSIDNVYFWKGIKDGNLDITVKPKDTVTSITASQLISITPNPLQPFRCTALVASSVALILPGGSGASSFFEILGAELKAATIKGDPLSFNNIAFLSDL